MIWVTVVNFCVDQIKNQYAIPNANMANFKEKGCESDN